MRVLAVTNIYPTSEHPTLGTFIAEQIRGLRRIGLEVDTLCVDRTEKGMAAYFDLPDRLQSQIELFRPDVVHAMYGGVMAAQVMRTVKQIPTVVTFHGSDLLGEHLSGMKRELFATLGVWASHRAARRASAAIVVSKKLRDKVGTDIPRDRLHVIPCGIDLDRIKPLDIETCRSRLGWSSAQFHVLFPANNGDPVKRPGLAQASVDALIKSGVRAELHFLKGVPYGEVPIWINASDALLLTSLHEGSPTVVKEAMACNVPIVAVDVGDVAEQIQGVEGCFISEADPQELAAKLRLVYMHRRRVSSRALMDKFDLDRIAIRIADVYESTIKQFNSQKRTRNEFRRFIFPSQRQRWINS